jgi:hypothetical protein
MPYPRAAVAGLAVPDPPDGQFLAAWHGPCNGGFPCWWYGTRLGATPRACSADARRYATALRRFGGSASATIAAPCMPANTRQPASTDGKPEISHGPGGPHHHLSCLLHGRQESARNGALPGPARSHADSTPSVMRGKEERSSWSARSGFHPGSRPGPTALRVSSTQRSDPNRCAARLLLYLAAVLAPNPGFGFSNYASDMSGIHVWL